MKDFLFIPMDKKVLELGIFLLSEIALVLN